MTPPDCAGADFLAALLARDWEICFRGALPPMDFLAVCLVLAIVVVVVRGKDEDGKLGGRKPAYVSAHGELSDANFY